MTLLVSGSMLLIAGSAVALVFGWVTANEALIWGSIVCSGGAGALLALGYWKSRGELKRATAVARAAVRPAPPEPIAEEEAPLPEAVASWSALADTGPIPAVSESSATIEDLVVAIPDRKKFHKASCRFAASKGAEKISREVAERRGYAPCGVCKP
jgi:hypothetical protein